MTTYASGTFEVKLTPQDDKAEDATLGRMTIDKQFHGDIEGVSLGQMLTALGSVEGSADYVAVERVSGTLHGRSGSFKLQHSSVMRRGEPQQNIIVGAGLRRLSVDGPYGQDDGQDRRRQPLV